MVLNGAWGKVPAFESRPNSDETKYSAARAKAQGVKSKPSAMLAIQIAEAERNPWDRSLDNRESLSLDGPMHFTFVLLVLDSRRQLDVKISAMSSPETSIMKANNYRQFPENSHTPGYSSV